jgi:ATP-dependent Clp protease protease subunit
MARLAKESIDRFYDYRLHIESRTIYIGDGDEGEVDAEVARKAIKAFHLLVSADKEKPINVYINSFGGCMFNGMAIYDVMKNCPCHVTAFVLGAAMSMGSVILQAADVRVAYPNATIMVHDGSWNIDDTFQSFHNWAEFTKKSQQQMYRIYAERSGRPAGFWRKKCAADLILTAQEAKSLGLVDSIYGET